MQTEKTAARKGAIAGGMMGKSDKSNLLLTSLEEIKKSSAEEEPPAKAEAPVPGPAAAAKGKSAGNLLDSLLSEVREEAEREVEEITRTLEEKTNAERKLQEDEEQKKKAQYEKLIQEEGKRRQGLIQRREDDKRRKEMEERHKEQARLQLLAEQARLKKRRRVLLATSGVGVSLLLVVVALVVTGVIPLGPPPGEEASRTEVKSTVPTVDTGTAKKMTGSNQGTAIGDTELDPFGNIDGLGGVVLDIPEQYDIDSLLKPHPLRVQPVRTQVESVVMREKVVRAFISTGSGGSSVKGDGGEGGIKIDDSIFDVGADKNKKKKR